MFDELYLNKLLGGYIDQRLISNLEFLLIFFLMMLVMNALKISGLLSSIGRILTNYTKNEKRLALFLCLFVFVISAFLTNDVALLGIVPLTIIIGVSSRIDVKKIIIFEGISANAGSLLTPFGNPQNIYIAVYYKVSLVDFVKAMAPLWLVSMILLVLIIHLLFTEKPLLRVHRKHPHYGIAALGLTSLFVIILYFFHVLPVIITVIIVFVLLIWTYKLKRIFHIFDWKLFLLFVAIAFGTYAVLLLWSVGIAGLPVLFSAVGLSQVISNVPATFILSGTADWKLLALGVNIGGSGTLISSIATLIAYRYAKKYDRTTRILDFMKWGALFCFLQLILVLPIIYFTY